jgi:hypothetical protein
MGCLILAAIPEAARWLHGGCTVVQGWKEKGQIDALHT